MSFSGNSQFTVATENYGPRGCKVFLRWAPSTAALQVLTTATVEAHGVSSISRTSAGLYVISFVTAPKAIVPCAAGYIDPDAANYHFVNVVSTNAAAGTATVSHKSVAVASVASGATASDTVNELYFEFFLRLYN